MKIWNKRLVYLSMAVFLIVGISGCINSNSVSNSGITGSNSISKSSVSSKLAASENSGIFSEKAYPMSYGSCKNMVTTYKAVYNNGDTLEIKWDSKINPPCDNTFFGIEYNVKIPNSNDELINKRDYSYAYQIKLAGDTPGYSGPSGHIWWTTDGRVNPSSSTGDINEANEFINLGKNKANEIVNRYNSGQLR